MIQLSLYDAKTGLSSLVDRAVAGEEMIIAKNGVAMAKLGPLPPHPSRQSCNALGISYIAPDFDQTDEEIIALFDSTG